MQSSCQIKAGRPYKYVNGADTTQRGTDAESRIASVPYLPSRLTFCFSSSFIFRMVAS
jgi:hypothetical protein